MSPPGPRQMAVGDVVVGAGRSERHRSCRRGSEAVHHDGIVDETDRDVLGALIDPDPRLGGLVGLHRPVPVEVIGCQVEPGSALGTERRGPGETEAGALDDEGVEVHHDRVDQRGRGVPGIDRSQARRSEHLHGQQGRGRLAVGSGDRHHRTRTAGALLLPAVGEFDLRHELDVCCLRRVDHRVRLGHARRRADEIAGRDQFGELVDVGTVEQLHAELGGNVATSPIDDVVGDDHVDVVAQQGSHGRLARDREPVDEGASHSCTCAVKSAMKIASAEATQIAEINQKRMITVVSGQPISSKW